MLSVHTCPLATLGGKKTGGMNVYVAEFSRELALRGIEVDVFTRSEDDCQPTVKHDLGPGARVIHIPAGPEKPIPTPAIAAYLDDFVAGVLEFASNERISYDLIHGHYWMSGLVAEELKYKWPDIPILQMFHTLGHMKNRVTDSERDRAPQARIDGETHILSFADRIIAATWAEYAQLHWLYGADMEKVEVIPPGVNLNLYSPIPQAKAKEQLGIPEDYKNILFAGRIEPLKGIDTLLLAIDLIQRQNPELASHLNVNIIGGDPWSDTVDNEMVRLQDLRQSLGVTEIVTFLGPKVQDDLPEYYAAAEMVVMPSHYESFGLVALEAMAMGTPVIASEVGGLAFLVRDGIDGFHVPSRNPEALAERIFSILTDRSCREQLGMAARAHAQEYSWSIIVDKMLGVYHDLLPN